MNPEYPIRQVPDQYVKERKARYLHMGDDCIRPGGCSGTLEPLDEVVGWARRGHEDWLMCDRCLARYRPFDNKGFIWADAGYYGYMIEYE